MTEPEQADSVWSIALVITAGPCCDAIDEDMPAETGDGVGRAPNRREHSCAHPRREEPWSPVILKTLTPRAANILRLSCRNRRARSKTVAMRSHTALRL